MASAALNIALQVVTNVAIKEIALRCQADADLQWLERYIGYALDYIKDSKEREEGDNVHKRLLRDIEELAKDAANELENYNQPRTTMNRILHPFTSKNRHIAKKITSFKRRFEELRMLKTFFDIQRHAPSSEGTSRAYKRSGSAEDQEDLIGFEDVAAILRENILFGNPFRKVVSIYGMGGLGKTALAKRFYHSEEVIRGEFVRVWIDVSQDYKCNDLIKQAIRLVRRYMNHEDNEKMNRSNEDLHAGMVHDFLRTHSYLVVLDNVWDRNVWQAFEDLLPNRCPHGRVILTTRKKSVADGPTGAFVQKLRFLSTEESMNLFQREMGDEIPVTLDMRNLAQIMVNKCGGLPLAITCLGKVLKIENDLASWRRVNEEEVWGRLIRYPGQEESLEIENLLNLSYDDEDLQTDERRPLFLYTGMFPSGHQVDINKLFNMWITENDIGLELYFKKLIDYSLIVEEGSFWGKPTTCKLVHDLIRYLIIQKAKEVNYFDIFPPPNYNPHSNHVVHMPSIRHAIHGQGNEYTSYMVSTSTRRKVNREIHTILFFHTTVDAHSLATQLTQFRNLQVLDLTGIDFSKVPLSLSNMLSRSTRLKFLVLADTLILELPFQLSYLQDLRFLDIGTRSMCDLIVGIHPLAKLTHLHGFFHQTLYLPTVQVLQSVRILSNQILEISRKLHSYNPSLQELSLRCKPSDSLSFLSKFIHLETLIISSCGSPPGVEVSDLSYLDLPSIKDLSACPKLSNLWLDGTLKHFPAEDEFPRSMERLILSRSKLTDDPMPTLERLPNLISLELMNAYQGENLVCNGNGFIALQYLRVCEARDLTKWEVHEGAMPRIKGLTISECPKLELIPQRFQYIPNIAKTKSVYGEPQYTDYNPT